MPDVSGVFDIRTFLFSIVIIELFLSMMMILYARRHGVYPGFGFWALQMLLLAMAHIFGSLRGIIPDGISIIGTNLFTLLAFLMTLEAISRFYAGRECDKRWYLVVPLLMAGVWYWYAIVDSLVYRTILISIVLVILLIPIIKILVWENKIDENKFTYLLVLIYLILIVIFIERAVDYYLNPVGKTYFDPSVINILLYLYVLIASIGATFIFLLINVERKAQELEHSHAEIRRLANRFDLAISSAGAGVWELDPDSGSFTFDSQIFRMFGLEQIGHTPGSELEDRVYPEDRENLSVSFQEIHNEGESVSREYRVQLDNGETRFHLAHARGFTREDGEGLRIIGLTTDITPLRRAQNALTTALRKVSILSQITRHDILNCVTVIGLTARMLQEKTDENSEDWKQLSTIGQMGDQITRMIGFTREYEDIGLKEPVWIDPVLIMRRASIQSLHGGISIRLPPPGLMLYGDQMIEKVFYNLVDNSIRHGGEIRTISLEYQYESEDLLIRYTDDGTGIQPEYKEKIFSYGYGKNSGMGLFLCREILSITGLTIIENGDAGKGAMFVIRAGPGLYRKQPSPIQ